MFKTREKGMEFECRTRTTYLEQVSRWMMDDQGWIYLTKFYASKCSTVQWIITMVKMVELTHFYSNFLELKKYILQMWVFSHCFSIWLVKIWFLTISLWILFILSWIGLCVTCFCGEIQVEVLWQFHIDLIHRVIFKLFSDLKNEKIAEIFLLNC